MPAPDLFLWLAVSLGGGALYALLMWLFDDAREPFPFERPKIDTSIFADSELIEDENEQHACINGLPHAED